ncbi:MAG: amidohydrolase family protein [Burkholderiales bacterium]
MNEQKMDRRALLKAASALAVTGVASSMGCAQTGGGSGNAGAGSLPARGEFVIRGASILTMDAAVGDFARGDVHVRNGIIVAVAKEIAAPAATMIDAGSMICMPGFVETHWHLWTSLLRPMMSTDDPKRGYFPVSNGLGRHFVPLDHYRSVRLGLAEALSAGATTVHNWAHNIASPDHADAELRAMRSVGLRGRFSYGPAQGSPNDQPMDLAGLAKIKQQWMPNDGMLTLGISSRNVGDSTNLLRGNISVETARKDWDGARALGLPITMHTSGPSPIMLLEKAGLLGPDVQLVHPLLTTPEDRKILKARGVSYSMSPVGESQRPASAGVIQLAELLEAGVKVSMSIDLTGTYNVDFFQSMRFLYSLHRHRVGSRVPLTAKRLVQLATLDGAVDLGIANRTGSITPGKRADMILVRTSDINMALLNDPYEALVNFAQPRNVDTVIADGRILQRGGRFTALDYAEVLREAKEAGVALRARAGQG